MDVERFHRVLVVGRHEHDRDSRLEQLEHFEAVQLRHLDVEEDDPGRELPCRPDGLEPVGALAEDAHAADPAEVLAQDRARRLLVVDDEDADLRRGAHAGISAGTEMTTRYRSPRGLAANIALSP